MQFSVLHAFEEFWSQNFDIFPALFYWLSFCACSMLENWISSCVYKQIDLNSFVIIYIETI